MEKKKDTGTEKSLQFLYSHQIISVQNFRSKNINPILFAVITPPLQMWELGARSECGELMARYERQQMLLALTEVMNEKNFTHHVGSTMSRVFLLIIYAVLYVKSIRKSK
jgi:hypothetical protein